MNRREFIQKVGLGALTAAGGSMPAQSPKRKPNIVWIMADDLGYGHLGCYGQKYIRTPNIDRIAAEGIRFTDAYAGCTVCAPSRSVLMTGLHMGHTSVRSNPGGVPLLDSDVTVGEVLKSAGYQTGCFGKWGLGDLGTAGAPNKQGFDQFFGYLNQVHAHYFYPEFLIKNEGKFPLPGNRGGKQGQYSHDVIAEQALQFVRDNRARPFFLYVPFTIPHLEWLVPEDSLKEYRGKFPETPYIDKRKHYGDQPHPRAAIAGMITRMDRDVGRILALLKELKLDQDTIVFFASDNGGWRGPEGGKEMMLDNGPLRGFKTNLYEGGIRVPLIARWPGKIQPGRVTAHQTAFWDFLPTAAELAGVDAPAHVDGHSIVPELIGAKAAGRPQKKHEFLYWEYPAYNSKTKSFRPGTPVQAVRMGHWKAVRPQPDGPLELYNLKDDIAEQHDVSARHPEIMARIEDYLKTARVEPRPQADPETGGYPYQ